MASEPAFLSFTADVVFSFSQVSFSKGQTVVVSNDVIKGTLKVNDNLFALSDDLNYR